MKTTDHLADRFGSDAADRLASILAPAPAGGLDFCPAPPDRCRGALVGAFVGEALPFILHGRQARPGPDSYFTLVAVDAALSGADDHPVRFAARLAASRVSGAGEAAYRARRALRHGAPWWRAASMSAGAAAAARAPAFGLLWADDPERAAHEAAVSALVTHGHPAAAAGAAAVAAAVALAARGDGPLDGEWLAETARICGRYPQKPVQGSTVAGCVSALAPLTSNQLLALRGVGVSPLVTEAVPAALAAAASAPVPVASAFGGNGRGWDLEAVSALHQACRSMAGAFIGARYGENAWNATSESGGAGLPPEALADARGLATLLRTADRIAGKRVKPVEPGGPGTGESADGSGAEGGENGKPPVHVWFLIDRSGSMSGLQSDVVDGFNGFVAEQRRKDGDCALTLVQFDSNDPFEVLHDGVPVAEVPKLTRDQYRPRGATPLLDALGRMIEDAEARLARLAGPEDQILAVFTDGLENASHRWTREALFDEISQRKQDGWTFVFMGANQDSYRESGRLHMDRGSTQNFAADSQGVRSAFRSFDRAMVEYRSSPAAEREVLRSDFFGGRKEAEEDLERRARERRRRARERTEAGKKRAEAGKADPAES